MTREELREQENALKAQKEKLHQLEMEYRKSREKFNFENRDDYQCKIDKLSNSIIQHYRFERDQQQTEFDYFGGCDARSLANSYGMGYYGNRNSLFDPQEVIESIGLILKKYDDRIKVVEKPVYFLLNPNNLDVQDIRDEDFARYNAISNRQTFFAVGGIELKQEKVFPEGYHMMQIYKDCIGYIKDREPVLQMIESFFERKFNNFENNKLYVMQNIQTFENKFILCGTFFDENFIDKLKEK